ncbi:MAG: biopolymer transporter ExbD [Magnetococcales bacterium]|nr:biopolymer transporter ExbD [Magnetococcales bacterium]
MAAGLLDHDGEDRPLSEINVTPLVDVMLVLLVIFIIVAPLMAQSIPVALPEAKGEPESPAVTLTLTLQHHGDLALDGAAIPLDALTEALRQRLARDPELALRVEGDQRAAYGALAKALAAAQQAGVRKLAFVTQGEGAAPAP